MGVSWFERLLHRESSMKTPVLFISHGAPTFALEPSRLGPLLNRLGQSFTRLRAILVVSPHWQTHGVSVMATAQPKTMHDFGGFPAALNQLHYRAPGAPELAEVVAELLNTAGWPVSVNSSRGLDHGAWVPLMHLLPKADVPVFQVSMPHDLETRSAFQLGRTLAPLREQGVLVVASGSMTHNLYEFRQFADSPEPYAGEFTHWVRQTVQDHDVEKMLDYRHLAPHAVRAHPTDEHFLPLLVAMGTVGLNEPLAVLDGGIDHGVLSMESYAWGLQ
jgi:4,5-DOPA dioxygenase extradiol